MAALWSWGEREREDTYNTPVCIPAMVHAVYMLYFSPSPKTQVLQNVDVLFDVPIVGIA